MYVRNNAPPGTLNAAVATQGNFAFNPNLDKAPTVTVQMTYLNSTSRVTFGNCPYSNFSAKTYELFLSFLKSAEEDFGKVVFEEGAQTAFPFIANPNAAESGRGLPKGLGDK